MILVAGGTGVLGNRLIRLLTDRGLGTWILSRDSSKARSLAGDQVEIVSGDVRDPAAVKQAVVGVRTVISAITGFGPTRGVSPRTVDWEGNANLIRAAKAAGVEHFVLLSITQAAADHPIELFRMKYRAEEELRGSGLAWTIIRPTAYMETWLGVLGAPLLDAGSTRIFGRGANPMNFVSCRDVASYVELAVTDGAMRGATVDVGGPDDYTFEQLLQTFQSMTGATGKVSHIPLPMMQVMSVLLKPFNPSMAGLIEAAVVMDSRDMTFDASETRRRYPSMPSTSLADVIRADYAGRSPGSGGALEH